MEAIRNLPCRATHARVYPRKIDRNPGIRQRTRIEKRIDQLELVKRALIVRPRLILKRIPDGAHAADVISHACRRVFKRCRKASLDMRAHLSAQAKMESPIRVALQIPGSLGHRERRARKGDCDIGTEINFRGIGGGVGQRKEGVVRRLEGPHAVEAETLKFYRSCSHLVWHRGRHQAINFHHFRSLEVKTPPPAAPSSAPRPLRRARDALTSPAAHN